jgi:DNA-binding NtrC family response regulator
VPGQTVLLVEDEDSIRLTLRDYLQSSGFTVYVASDGVGAIKQLLDHEIDSIVTDYRMKGFGGDYWLRFLKVFYPDKRVIVTSGFIGSDSAMSFPLFQKPFDFDQLAHCLADGLDITSHSLN